MNFVSLSEVLASSTAAAAATYQAAALHARLHNADEHPRWAEVDAETGRALRNDTVADEGLAILKHRAGQARRDAEERGRHVAACIACGLDPASVPQSFSMADLRKFPIWRVTEIGFDRDELAAFLAPEDAATEKTSQRLQGIQNQRKKRILEIIEELGYDAKKLPANQPGKRGPKSEVRDKYKQKFRGDYTDRKYKTAWEQLAADGDVVITN